MPVIAAINAKFDITPMMYDRYANPFDILAATVFVQSFRLSFDINAPFREFQSGRFDAVALDQLAAFSARFDAHGMSRDGQSARFDSETQGGLTSYSIRFDATPRVREIVPARWDALREFANNRAAVPARFDFPLFGYAGVRARFDSFWPVKQFFYNRFDAYVKMFATGVPGRFDSCCFRLARISNRFHAIPQEWNAKVTGYFDAFETYQAAVPVHKQAFVKPGWRVLIHNTKTNEQRDLGFIEADTVEKSIKDVDLPDGDYEITLLHSSLFWQNAVDRVVRNVTIRADEDPILGLPPVLNLTSEVTDGVTRISWASNSGDYEDCEFGLWFAETPPVVTFREPDQRVAYTASDVEYGVNITQSVPLWCVVMAIKGNMRGPASEIFLDWSSELPRRPDDQMAFDVFLDEKLEQLRNASGKVEGVEWDTSEGYW